MASSANQQSTPIINAIADGADQAATSANSNRTSMQFAQFQPCPDNDCSQAWLRWLKQLLIDAHWLALVDRSAGTSDQSAILLAKWPAETALPDAALALASQLPDAGSVVYKRRADNVDRQFMAIALDSDGDSSQSVLLLDTVVCNQAKRKTLVKLCRWANAWPGRRSTVSTTNSDKLTAVSLTDTVIHSIQRHRDHRAAAYALVNALVRHPGCVRASLGLSRDNAVKVLAVSGQANIDQRRQAIQLLANCMQETRLRGKSGRFTHKSQSRTMPAHADLFVHSRKRLICSMLLSDPANGNYILLVELESSASSQLQQIPALEAELQPVAALLNLTADADSGLLKQLRQVAAQIQFRIQV